MHTLLKIGIVLMMQKMVDGQIVTMIENVQKFHVYASKNGPQSDIHPEDTVDGSFSHGN